MPSAWNCTDPATLPEQELDTVAVSGTGCPKTDGFTPEVTVVAEVAAVTVCTSGPPLLGKIRPT